MDQAYKLRNLIKSHQVEQRKAKVLTVTSGKGGVGKSSISINLAISLSKLGKKVLILDADFGLANVEVMLGIHPKYTLADMIYQGKTLREVVTPGPENIGFISGGSGIHELINLDTGQVKNLSERLYELDEIADYIIIDTGAGISDGILQFILSSHETLLVVTPEPTSITDAYALLKTVNGHMVANQMTEKPIKMIVNKVFSEKEGRQLYEKLNMVVGKFLDIKLQYLGSVLQDRSVVQAIMGQKPVTLAYPNAAPSKALIQIATTLVNGGEQEQELKGGIKHLLSGLFSNRQVKY